MMQKKNPTEGEANGEVVNREEQEERLCVNSCSGNIRWEKPQNSTSVRQT